MTTSRYHHGALRPALLDAALEAIGEVGPTALSMRDVARRAGVSHAASAHHFGDKAGLLTALAAQGYDLLADELAAAWAATGRFLEVGVAYVRFAVAHPAHFAVMFRPELLHLDDPALRAAKARSAAALYGGVERLPHPKLGPIRWWPGWPPGRSCTASRRSGSTARSHRPSVRTLSWPPVRSPPSSSAPGELSRRCSGATPGGRTPSR